jgi:hypothetical protein
MPPPLSTAKQSSLPKHDTPVGLYPVVATFFATGLADLYAKAGYIVPDELPSFASYLPVRYPDLPQEAVAELRDHFENLLERLGLSVDGIPPLLEEHGEEPLADIS